MKKNVRCRPAIIRNVEWNVTPQKLDPKIQKHWSSLASSFHYMYRFMWSLQQSNDIVTSCLRFVHVKICFNTNYLSHLALLYKMIVSMATCALMCIKVLFLKANFLVYTTQKSQPSVWNVYVSVYYSFSDKSSIMPYHILDLMYGLHQNCTTIKNGRGLETRISILEKKSCNLYWKKM